MIGVGIRELSSPNWQPIETAPKDGTAVLLFTPGKGRWIGSFEKRKPEWKLAGVSDDPRPERPTHWHPLPPPPESSGRILADAHSKNPPEAEHG